MGNYKTIEFFNDIESQVRTLCCRRGVRDSGCQTRTETWPPGRLGAEQLPAAVILLSSA